MEKFNIKEEIRKIKENMNLNKILILVAIILVIACIIAISVYLGTRAKENQLEYEDKITAHNKFEVITVNFETRQVKRDSQTTTLRSEFGVEEEQENIMLESIENLKNFFENTTFEIDEEGNEAIIRNEYQTKRIILKVKELQGTFNEIEEMEELGNGIYILSYGTEKRTKEAYEYMQNIDWIEAVELDEVLKIETISDESQTVYEDKKNNEQEEYKSYGVKAMGVDNYQNIIQENGNATDIVVSTIGYGAKINDEFFGGRISEDIYNFVDNNKDITETIPQGSRILEVIQDSTTHNVKLLPLVVIDNENYTTISRIVKAILYATEKSDIVCYEMVHKESKIINEVLKNAFKENVPVCSVTTSQVEESNNYPANHATTISVAAIDKNNNITNYSGKGEYIDFAIYSTDVEEIFNKNSSVSKWSGSEYANAQIASIIALIKTYHKDYTILEVYNMIRNYCKDLGEEGKDSNYGYGCPNFSQLKISDIDKTSPVMEDVVIDNEKWEKTKNIKIKAKDDIRILGWKVTETEESPKEWEELKVLASSLDVTSNIEKNGKYYIWVKDSAENVSKKVVEVAKVDNKEPNIQYSIDSSKQSTENYVTINITATDEESGLKENAYSWDGLAWGKENNQLKVSENGIFTVYVRDNLENVAKKEITVNSFPQKGKAIIEDGSLIKSIDVSPEWSGDTNNNVIITFEDNLNIKDWKITETSEPPSGFETALNNDDLEYEDEENQNSVVFSSNTILLENVTNDNTSVSLNNNEIQGHINITITVSLKENVEYYLWAKDNDSNILCQSFKIQKNSN